LLKKNIKATSVGLAIAIPIAPVVKPAKIFFKRGGSP
jgi:hypothetical protein